MSPAQFHQKREITNNNTNDLCSPPLKINKDSHFIKKSSSSPSSSSSSSSSASSMLVNGVKAASNKPQQRHPVIIYTHAPKVIHTHPKDFMALVQKLTGYSRSDEETNNTPQPKQESGNVVSDKDSDHKKVGNEDNDTSSRITDENNCSISIGDNQVNSCFMTPPIMEPPLNPYMTNLPVFTPNSADFLCSNQPFLNYPDSLYNVCHNMRSSISSSASLEGTNEFREY